MAFFTVLLLSGFFPTAAAADKESASEKQAADADSIPDKVSARIHIRLISWSQ